LNDDSHVGVEEKCYNYTFPPFTSGDCLTRQDVLEYTDMIQKYYSENSPSDSKLTKLTEEMKQEMKMNGWGVIRGFLPPHIISLLQGKLKTALQASNSQWNALSGGGKMYNKNIAKRVNTSEWFELKKLVRSVLSPLLVSLGWVEVKEGYEYRCSGGTFLLYIGNCNPQTWHCDSNDLLSISIIIPLTEECRMPEFAAPEHQIRGLISEFCQKFGLTEFPKIEKTLATEEQRKWWREHILVASFRGQNYNACKII
jgi:hypothetical protein